MSLRNPGSGSRGVKNPRPSPSAMTTEIYGYLRIDSWRSDFAEQFVKNDGDESLYNWVVSVGSGEQ